MIFVYVFFGIAKMDFIIDHMHVPGNLGGLSLIIVSV